MHCHLYIHIHKLDSTQKPSKLFTYSLHTSFQRYPTKSEAGRSVTTSAICASTADRQKRDRSVLMRNIGPCCLDFLTFALPSVRQDEESVRSDNTQ